MTLEDKLDVVLRTMKRIEKSLQVKRTVQKSKKPTTVDEMEAKFIKDNKIKIKS